MSSVDDVMVLKLMVFKRLFFHLVSYKVIFVKVCRAQLYENETCDPPT